MISIVLAVLAIVPAPESVSEYDGFLPLTAVVEDVNDPTVGSEGYVLDVNPSGRLTVRSSSPAGRFYARKTLEQIADWRGYRCVRVVDRPRYPWRGVHIDDCRHFFGKEAVMRVIDLMSRYKMNILHWHLTEDQGWRLEIPGYPDLVKYGAVRPASPAVGARMWWHEDESCEIKVNTEKYGPYFYTESDLREIVAYASERQVKVVPEIEFPGHVYAALAAYPQFACRPENLAKRTPRCIWGVEQDVLCVGNDEAVKFMENVLEYVCRIFPSDVIHIGGDECPSARWKDCPKCQKRLRDEKLGDEHGLQAWITRRFVKFLADRGKRAVGWDEYLLGDGIPKDAIGMSWRLESQVTDGKWLSPSEMAVRGHDVVMTPNSHCYFDYGQGLPDDPYQYNGRCITLRKCHSFDPCEGLPNAMRRHVLGGQCNNWSEYTWDRHDLDWKMWPRTCALAEALWCGERRPAYEDFLIRMKVHRSRLLAMGVNCAPLGRQEELK